MREVAFIRQNKEKWLSFEKALKRRGEHSAEALADGYISIMNDLSYARTFYPKSKTVIFLNDLAALAYQRIYKTRRHQKNRVKTFFQTDVPLLMYRYRTQVALAFAVFFTAVAIGAVSARAEPDFVRLILGDQYVNMTLDNIEAGNPMAVYESGSQWGGFIAITINNIRVGVLCFVLGVTAGLGTFYVSLQNGIMVGAFQFFFYEKDVFWQSVRSIWIHGAMEIFAIIIETAAGFVVASSILFPHTYSRLESFKRGFKNGLMIFLSTVPFTMAAGLLEGYLTRFSITMPVWASSAIILGTLSLISWYYLIYPRKIYLQHRHDISAT